MSNSQTTSSYTVSHAIDAYGFGRYQILLSVIVGKFKNVFVFKSLACITPLAGEAINLKSSSPVVTVDGTENLH